jgi:hypothetical protein
MHKKYSEARGQTSENNITHQPAKRIEVLEVIIYDDSRKWDETLENPRKGKFTPEETKKLIRSLNQYLLQNSI